MTSVVTFLDWNKEILWAEEERTQRTIAKQWRDIDMEYRRLEIRWNKLDKKRRALDQTSFTLQTIAQVTGFILYSQLTCYVNMTIPDPAEFAMNFSLLMIWAVLNVTAILVDVFVLVVAIVLYIAVLQISVHEGPEDDLPDVEVECYSRTKDTGVVMTEEQYLSIWQHRYELWFQRLIKLFSCSAFLFLSSLPATAHIRYFMSQPAAWIAVGASIMAIFKMFVINSSMVPNLHQKRNRIF